MTLKTALQQACGLLRDSGVADPRLTAEVLLAHALRRDRTWLYAHPEHELTTIEWIHYGRYLHERLKGKPTQYITKAQEFWGREFRVNTGVLIPRPETEHIIEHALSIQPRPRKILDIGTGSGILAVTLALELGAEVWATDISQKALLTAARNADTLGATVRFVCCDLASALRAGFDLVVSNPPYISSAEMRELQPEVRGWEPHTALLGGEQGTEIYVRLIPEAARLLAPGGTLIVEMGWQSEQAVRACFDPALWDSVETYRDLAGHARGIVARRAQ
jgi:release factor glutamine methyltransferase